MKYEQIIQFIAKGMRMDRQIDRLNDETTHDLNLTIKSCQVVTYYTSDCYRPDDDLQQKT